MSAFVLFVLASLLVGHGSMPGQPTVPSGYGLISLCGEIGQEVGQGRFQESNEASNNCKENPTFYMSSFCHSVALDYEGRHVVGARGTDPYALCKGNPYSQG